MKRIFITFSAKDEEFARRVSDALTRMAVDVWLGGEATSTETKRSSAVREGLDRAQVMLVAISPGSLASPFVRDEWQHAVNRGIPIIPLLVWPADLPEPLDGLQPIDFYRQPFSAAMPELVAEIETKIASSVRKARPVDAPQYPSPQYPRRVIWAVIYFVIVSAVVIYLGIIAPRLRDGEELAGQPVSAHEIVLPEVDSLQVYSEPALDAETTTLEAPAVTLRLVSGGELWYGVKSATGTVYAPADALENDDLLYSLPLSITLRSSTTQYYQSPDFAAPSMTNLGGKPEHFLYGFWLSEEDEVWYRLSEQNGPMDGWLYDEDGRYPEYLAGYVEAAESISAYSEPRASQEALAIPQGAVLRVLAATPALSGAGLPG